MTILAHPNDSRQLNPYWQRVAYAPVAYAPADARYCVVRTPSGGAAVVAYIGRIRPRSLVYRNRVLVFASLDSANLIARRINACGLGALRWLGDPEPAPAPPVDNGPEDTWGGF